jgi:hypothetical protein
MRLALAAVLALLISIDGSAQTVDRDLLTRVGAYVGQFYQRFGSVVAEERYEQTIRRTPGSNTTVTRGASGPTATTLRSDFLLVQVPGEGWMPFRDVFERDGQQVRDREERLAKIFLSGSRASIDQANAIMNESARYNIGNVQRNINVPTLVLTFLTDDLRPHFSFKIDKHDDDGSSVIEFHEVARPTLVRTTNERDLPVSGRFWVDEATGTVRRTELVAVDTSVEAHITVTYLLDPGLDIWVPAKMEERYRRGRDPLEVRGIATYSRYRRFQVKTSENIDEPK